MHVASPGKASGTDQSPDQRLTWVDALKGAAILFVVLGHGWRGLYERNLVPDALFEAVDQRIYIFHMPVFFAAAGFFLARQVLGKPPADFVKGRLLRLIWPMVLWTYIFIGIKVLAGHRANMPVTASDLLISPFPGYLHLWFLWALFLHQMAVYGVLWLGRVGRITWAVLVLLMLGALALSVFPVGGITQLADWKVTYHAPFLILGMMLGRVLLGRDLPPYAGWVAALVFVGFVLPVPHLGLSGTTKVLYAMIPTMGFIVMLKATSMARLPGVRILTVLGGASMAIYLAHTIFSATTREVLLALGVTSLPLHVLASVLAGVLGPYLFFLLARRLKLSGIFGL